MGHEAHCSAAAELLAPQQQRCLLVLALLHSRMRLLEAQVCCLLAAAFALIYAAWAVPGIRCIPDFPDEMEMVVLLCLREDTGLFKHLSESLYTALSL